MSAALVLNWRSVANAQDSKFLVKGTELAVALCGYHNRFQICEVRTRDPEGYADCDYLVRDAETVTDDEIREGVRSRVVLRTASLEEAIAFCQAT